MYSTIGVGLQAHHVHPSCRILNAYALGHVTGTHLSFMAWSMVHRRLDLLPHFISSAWDWWHCLEAIPRDGGLGRKPTIAFKDSKRLILTRQIGLRVHSPLLAPMHEVVQPGANSVTRHSYLFTIGQEHSETPRPSSSHHQGHAGQL